MDFDWTTFLLEIGNFLVLLWLLKRFFYAPVQAAIHRRQSHIEQALTDAQRIRAEAEALQAQFAGRLADWEQEQEAARTALREEIAAERARLMGQLQAALAQEREKALVVEERRREELTSVLERKAITLGAAFVSRLLRRFADPELEAKVIAVTLEELEGLAPERRSTLQRALSEATEVRVMSAYALNDTVHVSVGQALSRLAGRAILPIFAVDPDLMAGVRITAGPWILAANLRDELRGFV